VRPTIVVGLGGSNGWFALAWAIEHAGASGASLVLCHACRADSPLASSAGPPGMALLEIVDPALARAVAQARMRLGGHRVTVRAEPLRPSALLLDAARNADLVVLGPPARTDMIGRGRTVHRVAAHARIPVVVARRSGGRTHGTFAGHVVVGVDGTPASRAALEFAFEEASLHRRPLAAVYVTDRRTDDFWYDETILSTHFAAEPAGLDLLATEIEPWTNKFPGVHVKRGVFAGRPLDGLLRAADTAALLVVGQSGHRTPAQALLGTIADGVIDAADSPVAVVKEVRS
jgi:nucleotide-binding universal stress UspA family protein